MSVLVVDDSFAIRRVIRSSLEAMGYAPAAILEARDGMEALEILESVERRVELVLTDWIMPRLNGLELLRRIKQTSQLQSIPVILVSCRDRRECIQVALREGASDYLVIPFRPELFSRRIRRVSKPSGTDADMRHSATILVADDSQSMRRYLRAALDQVSDTIMTVLEARDGIDALEVLSREPVDLAIVDWEMPNMDGFDVLRKMKASREWSGIPVVMITGATRSERVIEALQVGAAAFLVKPIRPATIAEQVSTLLRERRTRHGSDETGTSRRAPVTLHSGEPARTPLLSQLSPELIEDIRRTARRRLICPGEWIVHHNELVDSFHVIEQGTVELRAWMDAPVREVRQAGDCLAELAFLTGDSARMFAIARTSVTLLTIDRAPFEMLLASQPDLGPVLSRLLARVSEQEGEEAWQGLMQGQSATVSEGTLFSIVELASRTLRTGVLRFRQSNAQGIMYFRDGDLEHVREEERTGEEAFHRLMGWTTGTITFQPGDHTFKSQGLPPIMTLLTKGPRPGEVPQAEPGAGRSPATTPASDPVSLTRRIVLEGTDHRVIW